MIWVGIGIGVGIGALVILAFWLGQKSVAVALNESREVVTSPEPPVVASQPDQAPTVLEIPRAEEPSEPPELNEPLIDELPEIDVPTEPEVEESVPDASDWREPVTALPVENKPLDEPVESPTRRRWVGIDPTLCGAVNIVRETFPTGTRGLFRYTGSPVDGWKAQFSLRDDEEVPGTVSSRALSKPTSIPLDKLPELIASSGWLNVFNRVSSGAAVLESLKWPEENNESQARRRMVGTDQTFCGAVNQIQDTFPNGAKGSFRFGGISGKYWRVQFSFEEEEHQKDFGSKTDGDKSSQNGSWRDLFDQFDKRSSASDGRTDAEQTSDDEWEPPGYRERRERATRHLRQNPWDRYVGSYAATTANNSRGGLDKFGTNSETEHLGTWRDDL